MPAAQFLEVTRNLLASNVVALLRYSKTYTMSTSFQLNNLPSALLVYYSITTILARYDVAWSQIQVLSACTTLINNWLLLLLLLLLKLLLCLAIATSLGIGAHTLMLCLLLRVKSVCRNQEKVYASLATQQVALATIEYLLLLASFCTMTNSTLNPNHTQVYNLY